MYQKIYQLVTRTYWKPPTGVLQLTFVSVYAAFRFELVALQVSVVRGRDPIVLQRKIHVLIHLFPTSAFTQNVTVGTLNVSPEAYVAQSTQILKIM